MSVAPELLLIGAVAAVGILHTMVPDHWAPIALIARQRGWSKRETALAALEAGIGHVSSTLVIAILVWLAGVAAARRFGDLLDTVSGMALVAFGGWIAISAWRELHFNRGHRHAHAHDHGDRHDHDHHNHAHDHGHEHEHAFDPAHDPLYAPLRGERAALLRHWHIHRHGRGQPHAHFHDHLPQSAHAITAALEAAPPFHFHRHRTSARTALLLILGSSPMVEGIPAFFAAARYGIGLILVMSLVFALSTIATYVLLCVSSAAGLERVSLGPIERYGEVLSGGFIMLLGFAFWAWPLV